MERITYNLNYRYTYALSRHLKNGLLINISHFLEDLKRGSGPSYPCPNPFNEMWMTISGKEAETGRLALNHLYWVSSILL